MSKLASLPKSMNKFVATLATAFLLLVGLTASPVRAVDGNTTVRVHLYTNNTDSIATMKNWQIYTWNAGGTATQGPNAFGTFTSFSGEDTYGVVATLNYTSVSNFTKIGFKIAYQGSWSNVDQDYNRFIDVTSNNQDVWLKLGDGTVYYSDPMSPIAAGSQKTSMKIHWDESSTAKAILVAGQSKIGNGANFVGGTWYKLDGSSASGYANPTASGSDDYGRWITVPLTAYYPGQLNGLYMIVAGDNTYANKDGGKTTPSNVVGNRWISLTTGTNVAGTDLWLLTGDSSSYNGDAAFSFNPYGSSAPTITSITNATVGSGSAGKAGDTLTIAGTNLVPSNAIPARTSQPTVTIGGVAATVSPAPTASAASISVVVPAGLTAGANNVVLTNKSGSATSTGGFTLTAAPTITSLSSTTPVRGQSITVNGTNLTGATFTVGGVAATVTTASATAPVITVPTSAPVAAGSVVATTTGGSASTSVTVTKGTPTLVAPTATGINYGAALSTSTLSGGSASINGVTVAGSFAWTTPTAVPTAGTASYSVTFTPTDTTGFNNNTTTTSLVVGKTTPTINTTPAASAITYGQTLESSSLSGGVASVAGSFAFTAPTTAPATGTASYNVTFTPTDTSNYNTTNFNVSVTTNKATPSVTATPTAAGITYGAALSTATLSGGSASVPGTFAYVTPTAVPNAGTYSAAVRFTPTDTTNYNTVDFNINVSVAKVTPSITASPAPTKSPIRVGNALSQIGLSGGGASVAGTFAYATPAATPAQGAQSVAVVFTPTDTTNYNSVNFNITVTFSVALPAITGLSPSTAAQGDLVTITGTDFDGVTGVTIGGQAATITTNPSAAPNDTSLVIRVPANQTTGANNVILTTGAGSSSGAGLTVTAATPTITSLSATSGIRGDSITITGNFFNSVTAVKFGTVSATSYTVNSVSSISVTVPTAAANGAQNVTVTAAGGTSAGSSFTVNKTVPTVTATPTAGGITYGQTLASSSLTGGSASVPGSFAFTTPTAAPVAGTANQSVTFTPTDNTVYDTVVFNVSVTVSKATPSVTATPSAAAITYGAALSTATLSNGSASVAGTFAYATPAATPAAGTANQSVTFTPSDTSNYNNVTNIQVSVTVNKATPTLVAPTAGGLVTGQSLSSSVLSGGSASSSGTSVAGSFAWTNGSTVPSIGTANYGVTFTPTDTANFNTNTANVSVTTYGVPTITSVNPTSGLAAASLTITGTYLSGATVTIGGASATVTANTATSITTTVPAGATVGAGNVTVTTPGGTVSSSFTVLAAPTISSLSAASVARGGTLTINGTNLGSATVTIGGTAATVTSNTATAVAVTVPTSLAFGSQSVVVTTAGGTASSSSFSVAGYSSATLTIHYNKQDFTNINTYIHSWIQSGTGTVSGISVTGSLSTQSPETAVDALGYDSYGGVAKITYTGSNIQQVGFLVWTMQGPFVKDRGSETADRYRTLKSANDEIWIRNYDNVVSDSDPFSSINPSPNRPTTQTVVIHYDGNTTTYPKVYLATRSDLNDTAVNPYSYWVDPEYLDFNVPVTVSGPNGSSTSTVGTDAFGKYVSYTFPYNANHTTWANMIVGNAGLISKDGGQASTGNRYAPLNASGTTHIWLVSDDTSSNSGNAAYTSNPYSAPVVSSLSSTSGKAGDSITITGTGLKPQSGSNPTVTIGGVSATVTSATQTSVVVTVPAGLTDGAASAVVVSNAGGSSNTDKTFTIIPVPTISSLSVSSGVRGDSVTITGTGLTTASDVKFGSTSVSSVTVNSATSITVTVPSGASNGLQSVSVTTAGGTVTRSNAFTVNKTNPTVTATPSAAPITYGQTLASATLSGGSGSVAGSFAYATPTAAPATGSANQTVVFTPSDTTIYNTVNVQVSVTVNKANPTVTTLPSASVITYGQTLADSNLTGGSVSTAGSWSWLDSTIAPNAGSASRTAVFTPTDGTNFNSIQRSINVVTSKASASVSITGVSKTYTGSAQGVTIETTPSGLIVDVTYNGSSTVPTSAGTYAVSATINDANYAGSSSDSLVIAAATPDITWPVASEIRNPAALSASSLTGGSASFNSDSVAGSFVWATPTAVPTPGVADYSVKFVPTSSNFAQATNTVSLSVLQPIAASPTVGTVSQSGLVVSTSITAASGTSLNSVAVTVAGSSRSYSVDGDTYSVTLSRSDIGSSVVFSATSIATGYLESALVSSPAFTVTVATAPSAIVLSQSGLDVVADITLASGTSYGTILAQVGTGSPVAVTPDEDGRVAITLTRADKNKSVVFSATATQSGKAESDSTSSDPLTFGVANAPTVGTVTQSGLKISVSVDAGEGQTIGSVTATVDGSAASVSAANGVYSVTVSRSAIGKDVVFTSVASATGIADSAAVVTDAYTVLVADAPTYGAITQNELTITAKVNLGGDQTYGTVTASVDGGESQQTTYEGDGVFSITLTTAEIGKSVVFSASAAQSGRADSAPAFSTAYTMVTPAPQLANLSVDYGIRGASITANGNYLTGATIKVGGVSATTTSVNYTNVTFTVPSGVASGAVKVVATTANGVSTGLDFTVADAPTITGFSPWMGTTAPFVTNRGRTFDIYGTNLGNASFTVGDVPVSTVKAGDTVVRVMLPTDAALGTNQAVVATTPMGGSSNVAYIDVIERLPVITGFGTSAVRPGGLLTIYGLALDNPTRVRFAVGGIISGTVGVDASLTGPDVALMSTAITVRVPAGAQTGRIRVYTPVGFVQSTEILTVYPAPKITSMKVNSKVATGAARGIRVELTGSGFLNGSVEIGGVSAQIAASPAPKDTGITVIVPNGVTPGASTSLVVTSQYGVPSAALPFTVGYDKPVINSLSVSAGAFGSLLTINGRDFTGTTAVKFNSNKSANLSDPATVITDTAVTVKVPNGAITGVITLTARGGDATSASFGVFQPPTITSVTPNVAKAGDVVTVAGTNLTGTTFRIGGIVASPAPSFMATALSARVIVPAGASLSSAMLDSTLSVVANGGSASIPFTVVGAPAISSITGNPAVVGNDITINGSRFANPNASPSASPISVKVGGVAATIKSASATQIVVTVPLNAPVGNTSVSVTTLAGTVTSSLTAVPLAPTVTSLSVTAQNRGLGVRITGTNLLNASVTIGGVAATVASGATATSLTVTVPDSAPLGSQQVVVTTAGGSHSSSSLTVKVALPTVSAVAQSGTKRGVGTVTITGTNLSGATVKVGSVTVASSAVNVNNAGTSLTFTIPATAAVLQFTTLTVTTAGGSWQSTTSGTKIAVTA